MSNHSRFRDNSFGNGLHSDITDNGSGFIDTNFIKITDFKTDFIKGILQ